MGEVMGKAGMVTPPLRGQLSRTEASVGPRAFTVVQGILEKQEGHPHPHPFIHIHIHIHMVQGILEKQEGHPQGALDSQNSFADVDG